MPRLIDYVGRFEFIRQAAFAVVLHDGVEALSRRRVATELGTGVNTIRRSVAGWADLTRLAADHVTTRRRTGRVGRYSDNPTDLAANLVRALMPEDRTHLDEELVWLRLVAACAFRPSGLEPPGRLRREFQIAQQGYDDDLPFPAYADPTARSPEGEAEARQRVEGGPTEDRRTALEPYVVERERELRQTVGTILDLLEVPEPREDATHTVIGVIEGLTVSACLGRLSAEEATELAVGFVRDLGRQDGSGRAA